MSEETYYDLRNGLLDLKRDIFLEIFAGPLKYEAKKMKTIIGLSQECLVWRSHSLFKKFRVAEDLPIKIEGQFCAVKGKSITGRNNQNAFLDYRMEKGIYLLKLYVHSLRGSTSWGGMAGGFAVGVNTTLRGKWDMTCACRAGFYNEGSVFHRWSSRGNESYNSGNVAVEVDMTKRAVRCFVNDVLQPVYLSKIPSPLRFWVFFEGSSEGTVDIISLQRILRASPQRLRRVIHCPSAQIILHLLKPGSLERDADDAGVLRMFELYPRQISGDVMVLNTDRLRSALSCTIGSNGVFDCEMLMERHLPQDGKIKAKTFRDIFINYRDKYLKSAEQELKTCDESKYKSQIFEAYCRFFSSSSRGYSADSGVCAGSNSEREGYISLSLTSSANNDGLLPIRLVFCRQYAGSSKYSFGRNEPPKYPADEPIAVDW